MHNNLERIPSVQNTNDTIDAQQVVRWILEGRLGQAEGMRATVNNMKVYMKHKYMHSQEENTSNQ